MHFDYYDFAHHLQDSRIERIILMMAIRTPKRSFLNTNEFKKGIQPSKYQHSGTNQEYRLGRLSSLSVSSVSSVSFVRFLVLPSSPLTSSFNHLT